MFKYKSILLIVLLIVLNHSCKRSNLDPEKSNILASKRDEVAINAIKKWYLAQKKAIVNFTPVWEQASTYALANNEKLLVAPVWRYANVVYGTEFDFMRRLVVHLDAENQVKEAKITEMITEKDYLKTHQNNAFFWWEAGLVKKVIATEYEIDSEIFEPTLREDIPNCSSATWTLVKEYKTIEGICVKLYINGCGARRMDVVSCDGGAGVGIPAPSFPTFLPGTIGIAPMDTPSEGTIFTSTGINPCDTCPVDNGENTEPEVDPPIEKFHMKGKVKAIGKFVVMLNTLTGNTYNYDQTTKQIKRTGALNTVADATKSVILGNLIESMITGTRRGFTADIVNSDDETFFDGFGDTKIDMSDLNKITDPELKAALIAHIIEERLSYGNSNYATSAPETRVDLFVFPHRKGLEKEAEVINEMLGLTTTATKLKPRAEKTKLPYNSASDPTIMFTYWEFPNPNGVNRRYQIKSDKAVLMARSSINNPNNIASPIGYKAGGIIIHVIIF